MSKVIKTIDDLVAGDRVVVVAPPVGMTRSSFYSGAEIVPGEILIYMGSYETSVSGRFQTIVGKSRVWHLNIRAVEREKDNRESQLEELYNTVLALKQSDSSGEIHMHQKRLNKVMEELAPAPEPTPELTHEEMLVDLTEDALKLLRKLSPLRMDEALRDEFATFYRKTLSISRQVGEE